MARKDQPDGELLQTGRACCLLPPGNPVRAMCIHVASGAYLSVLSMLLTLAFCILQCFWQPLEPADNGINRVIDRVSLGVTIAFTTEIFIKSLAFGFLLDPGESFSSATAACMAQLRRTCLGCLPAAAAATAADAPQSLGRLASRRAQERSRAAALARLLAEADARLPPSPVTPGQLPPERAQPQEPGAVVLPDAAPVQQQCIRANEAPPGTAHASASQDGETLGSIPAAAATAAPLADASQPVPGEGAAPEAAAAAGVRISASAARRLEQQRQAQLPFLRSGWNRLDFVVVVASWISFLPGVGEGATAVRSLRLLLGLRSLTLFPGMKACTTAVLQALPMLANICLATLFLLWLFAIIGLQFYQEPLHHNCFVLDASGNPLPFAADEAAPSNASYTPAENQGIMCSTLDVWAGPHCPDGQACLPLGEPPQFGQLNYNNLASGLVYCFLITTTLWWGMTTSYLMEATVGFSYFFSLVQVLLGWFMLSLVLAVLADQYLEAMRHEKQQRREEHEEAERNGMPPPVCWLRRTWDAFAYRMVECWQAPLPGLLGRSREWRWRKRLQAVVGHWSFEAAVIASVLANTIVLAMPFYGMTATYASRLNTTNSVLTFFFVAEAALKVSTWGRSYFMDPFNCYDFVVTVLALATFFIPTTSGGLSGLRAVRILRLLRLLTVLPALQRFLRVLGKVLLKCFAFFGIVTLTVVLFAVLGMMTLGGKWDPAADPEAPRLTYNSFGQALVAVFDALTGSVEDAMFYAMYRTSGWAVLYYMALIILGNFLVLNLLVAVLYELFLEELEGAEVKHAGSKDWLIMHKLREFGRAAMGHLRCRKQRNSLEPSVEGPVPSDAELQAATAALPAEESPQSPSLKEQSSGFESASSTTQLLPATALPPPSMTSSSSGILKDADAGLASRLSSFQMHTGSRLSSFQSDPARHGAATSDEETGPPSAPAQPTGRRRVSDWLCGLVSCAPEWKGAVGKPLSEFQSNAFGVLSPHNRLRQGLFACVDDYRFEAAVLVVILFNCGVMAVESPGNSDHLAYLLAAMDWACLAVYIAELAVKLLALGAWAEKDKGYFRSTWNVLDFVVVVTSLLAATLSSFGWVAGLRLLRVLRPLRLIARSNQMKAVVACLVAACIRMAHVLAVAVLVELVFAILGMQLFQGEMHSCTSATCCTDATDPGSCTTVIYESQCTGFTPGGGSLCLWTSSDFNFDNLWNSITTLTVLMTGAAWSDTFFSASDTVGQGLQPQENSSVAIAAVFLVVYQCVGQLFIMNLFISVVLDCYNEQVEARGQGVMLTEGQREWVKAQLHLLRDLPEPKAAAPSHPMRRRLYAFITHPAFDWTILLLILASGLVMSLQHYGQGSSWDLALRWANDVFTVAFCLESLLKLATLLPRRYFSDGWNCFDFAVTWGSVPSIFLAAGPAVGVLRALRALRILRTIRFALGLKRIATTLYITLPTLANATLVFSLFLFMFSVLGNQLFYGILPDQQMLREGQGMTVFFNFQNVGNALMMLTDASTGDNWEKYLADTQVQPPSCDAATGSCGTQLASIFWVPFMVVCSFLLLSIVLAVVVDAYTMDHAPPEVTPRSIEQFKRRWSELDLSGVGFIYVAELHGLLEHVDYPLGHACHPQGPRSPDETAQMAKALLQVDADGAIYYHEVLQSLTARAAGISISSLSSGVQKELREETRMRKERQRQLQEQMRRRQLLRQQRITRNTQRGRSGAGGDTLRQFMETVTGGSSAAVLPSTRLGRRSGVMHTAASAPVALALRPSHETAVAIEMASSVPIPEVAEAVAPRIPGSVDHV